MEWHEIEPSGPSPGHRTHDGSVPPQLEALGRHVSRHGGRAADPRIDYIAASCRRRARLAVWMLVALWIVALAVLSWSALVGLWLWGAL